jgi:hypothetical protein
MGPVDQVLLALADELRRQLLRQEEQQFLGELEESTQHFGPAQVLEFFNAELSLQPIPPEFEVVECPAVSEE